MSSSHAKDVADKQADARKAQADADKRASLAETQNAQETQFDSVTIVSTIQ